MVNDKHATAAPDLVVEILSPGTRRRDKSRKRAVYDREGVGEYWLVDPEARSVTVLRRPRADAGLTDLTVLTLTKGATLESPLFPGLQIPLREMFRGRWGIESITRTHHVLARAVRSSTPCTRAPAEAIGTARHYNARQERRCLWLRAPGWAPMKSSG